jgi:hypothetical protein
MPAMQVYRLRVQKTANTPRKITGGKNIPVRFAQAP